LDENGDRVNFSLRTPNWQIAQTIIREMEVRGSVDDTEPIIPAEEFSPAASDGITVREACEKFLWEHTCLSPARQKKYRLLFNRLIFFLEQLGIQRLDEVTLDLITEFRAEWQRSGNSKRGQYV
jgi:hypothetical protein